MSAETRPVVLKPADKAVAGILLALLALAVMGIGWGVYTILPFLVEAAKNTVILGVEVFVILGLALALFQLWLSRDAIVYKFKMNAQAMRRKVVTDNPIGAIDISITTFQKRLESIDAESVSADAALKRLKNKINNREKTGMLDQALKEDNLANAAENLKRDNEVSQHAVAAERWRKGAAAIQPMIDDQEFIKGQLAKAREIAGQALADLSNQREVLAVQYEAYKESQAQAKAFRRFFGKSPELEMINFAVEAVEKQTTEAQADIDQLMHQLTPRIQAAQLQHEAEASEALRKRAEAKQLVEAQPPQLPGKVKDATTVTR